MNFYALGKYARSPVKIMMQCMNAMNISHINGYIMVKNLRNQTKAHDLNAYHISHFCNRDTTCVKFDENHAKGENKLLEANPPFCINCGYGHPQNFRFCPNINKMLN